MLQTTRDRRQCTTTEEDLAARAADLKRRLTPQQIEEIVERLVG
ncbi:hypothetical protein ABZ214_23310 [Streptomyces iakyrus]